MRWLSRFFCKHKDTTKDSDYTGMVVLGWSIDRDGNELPIAEPTLNTGINQGADE